MNDVHPLLAFAVTALIIEITPGPNMTYLAALSLSSGMRAGFAAVAGVALGLLGWGLVAAFGLAAALDNSPLLYGLLRWGGAVYLLWLAWEAWSGERQTSPEAAAATADGPWIVFRRGLITNLLNPKAAVFYVAVLPEFIQTTGQPVITQTLLLSVIYVGIATLIHAAIVAMAGSLQATVAMPAQRRLIRRALALALVGIAIWFAVATGRRP